MYKWEIARIISSLTIRLQGLEDKDLEAQLKALDDAIAVLVKAKNEVEEAQKFYLVYQKGIQELLKGVVNV